MMNYYLFETDWGWAGIVVTKKGVCCLELPAKNKDLVKNRLLQRCPSAVPGPKPPAGLARRAVEEVQAYFRGKRMELDIPVDLSGLTSFQKRVYRELLKVKYGQKRSYAWLAKTIGEPSAARAVAGALARNPIPLIIPCHRIIRSNGTIGGFSGPGGLNMKKRMLKLEGQIGVRAKH
jgi:methylated-DNA-[protein]-cysteine S-methyltransferase